MNTRTFAGVVIAALGLAACSSASTTTPDTTSVKPVDTSVVTTTTLSADDQKATDVAEAFASGVQAGAAADGIEITDEESACMAEAIRSGLGASRLVALAAQSGDIDSLAATDRSAMLTAISSCVAEDKLLGAGLSQGADIDEMLNAEHLAKSIADSLQMQGLTVTPDQATCMANKIFESFDTSELVQVALDGVAGKDPDPDVEARALQAVLACLPADVIASLANPNA